jgi:hypothetical protein
MLKRLNSLKSLWSRFDFAKKAHTLSICAICKNEGIYLSEWIEFHCLLGVEHFYLYDNGSTDATRNILAPYIHAGLVTYTLWPEHPGQLTAYDHCLRTFGVRSQWIAFLDIDEFLYGTNGTDLKLVLRHYEQFAAVYVQWLIFGCAGHQTQPEGPVIRNYTRRQSEGSRLGKSIVQPRYTDRSLNPHQFRYHTRHPVATDGQPINQRAPRSQHGAHLERVSLEPMRINHYVTKSYEECMRKMRRGRATTTLRRQASYFDAHNGDDVTDTFLWRFLPDLEKALQRRAKALS